MVKNLPDKAREIFEAAYKNSKKYYGGDKEMASKAAWSAVKKKYKKVEGEWQQRKNASSWKYQNVDPTEVLKTAEVDRDILMGTVGTDDNLSRVAQQDDDIKMSLCLVVKENDRDILRKLAEADSVYNRALLDKFKKTVLK